jgi:hypothetical protein
MLGQGAAMRILLALIALSLAVPAGAATRNFGIDTFDKIRVDGPYAVTLTTGVAPFAKASGSAAALDAVDVIVEGHTLIVRASRSSWGGYPGANTGPVDITIGTHELGGAWLNGAGGLKINRIKGLMFQLSVQGSGSVTIARAEVDQLNVAIGGTASATLAGRVAKLTAIVRGVSALDAAGLVVKDARIGAEGAATIKANVTNAAKIDGSGPATITLTGKPSCTVSVKGSTSVGGCR